MKQVYLTLALSLFFVLGYSQISIDKFSLPKQGDVLEMKASTSSSIDVGQTGGPYNWNFTSLTGNDVFIALEAPSAGSVSLADADFAIINNGTEAYYKQLSNNDLVQFYLKTTDPLFNAFEVQNAWDDDMIYRKANLNYGSNFNDFAEYSAVIDYNSLPDTLTDQIEFQFDSLKIGSEFNITADVDAYGEVALPDGNWDVLRVKKTITREVIVSGYIFGTWQVVPNVILKQVLGDAGAILDPMTHYEFEFYSNLAIEPITIVRSENEDGSDPFFVEYKKGSQTTNTYDLYNQYAEVNAYPNPSYGDVDFNFSKTPQGDYNILVYNILGKVVWEANFYNNGKNVVLKADLSRLQKGTYLYSIINNQGKKITTKRLVIVNP